ncbi:MAG: lysophospholipid acyltransferase family protein [Myxococcota bacterium]|nr:lysophospholipid acyltransferase family protein [Myxococcota bacterium]
MRSLLDRLTRLLCLLLLRAFYRRVEVVGRERVPGTGPVLFVANHPNSLVDPMTMLALLPRRPRFLAKSTLWQSPILRPFLALAGAVPVHRRQDVGEGADPSSNRDTFARCHEELGAGGAVALFPEGLSHHEASLQQLKTGAARIALGAPDAAAVRIVPVGLVFEEKARFRSRALLVVGEPIDPAPERARSQADERAAVRALTARIEAGLRRVTPNHESWDEARLIARAADAVARERVALPRRLALADRLTLQQGLAAAYRGLRERDPARARALAGMVARYDALLARHGLRDEHVGAGYPRGPVAVFLLDRLPFLLLALPPAGIGLLLNWPSYRLVGCISDRCAQQPDLPATYKILASFFLLPATWLVEAALAAWWWGPFAGLVVGTAAPLCGWVALRVVEEQQGLLRELRAWAVLRLRKGRAGELRARRRALRAEIEAELRRGLSGDPAAMPWHVVLGLPG